jgi:hypothetical protein
MLNMLNTPAKVNRKLIERQIRVKKEFSDIAIMKDLGKVKHLVEAVRRAEEFLQ